MHVQKERKKKRKIDFSCFHKFIRFSLDFLHFELLACDWLNKPFKMRFLLLLRRSSALACHPCSSLSSPYSQSHKSHAGVTFHWIPQMLMTKARIYIQTHIFCLKSNPENSEIVFRSKEFPEKWALFHFTYFAYFGPTCIFWIFYPFLHILRIFSTILYKKFWNFPKFHKLILCHATATLSNDKD